MYVYNRTSVLVHICVNHAVRSNAEIIAFVLLHAKARIVQFRRNGVLFIPRVIHRTKI